MACLPLSNRERAPAFLLGTKGDPSSLSFIIALLPRTIAASEALSITGSTGIARPASAAAGRPFSAIAGETAINRQNRAILNLHIRRTDTATLLLFFFNIIIL
jgi:hypothetical protein